MSEATPKRTVRLELTPRQKEQIRQATGREVNQFELQVEAVPATADRPAPDRCGAHARNFIAHTAKHGEGEREE